MEVYIFDKDRRCPYLHYAFLTTEIERYAIENLDWTDREHKVDVPFLYKWLQDCRSQQGLYVEHHNQSQNTIYQVSVDTLQDIISIAESGINEDWFEIYLTKY